MSDRAALPGAQQNDLGMLKEVGIERAGQLASTDPDDLSARLATDQQRAIQEMPERPVLDEWIHVAGRHPPAAPLADGAGELYGENTTSAP
jgi:hypothetical protein